MFTLTWKTNSPKRPNRTKHFNDLLNAIEYAERSKHESLLRTGTRVIGYTWEDKETGIIEFILINQISVSDDVTTRAGIV